VRTVLHQTDLFMPPADPDDHYDLAVLLQLAKQGRLAIDSVLVDHPPPGFRYAPDALGVLQLQWHLGLSFPTWIGGAHLMRGIDPVGGGDGSLDRGSDFILDRLRAAQKPLTIHIAGGCQDVAGAIDRDSHLFRERCAAIYLNAGLSGLGAIDEAERIEARMHLTDPVYASSAPEVRIPEYNVRLAPEAFRTVLQAPCPVYWMPCFDSIERTERGIVGVSGSGHASLFRVADLAVIAAVDEAFRNHLLRAVTPGPNDFWARNRAPKSPADRSSMEKRDRNLYCTPGMFHIAGANVDLSGNIVEATGIIDFRPISARVDDEGFVDWQFVERGTSDLQILDVPAPFTYQAAMTRAIGTLLGERGKSEGLGHDSDVT
jgi:hypothetical protein